MPLGAELTLRYCPPRILKHVGHSPGKLQLPVELRQSKLKRQKGQGSDATLKLRQASYADALAASWSLRKCLELSDFKEI